MCIIFSSTLLSVLNRLMGLQFWTSVFGLPDFGIELIFAIFHVLEKQECWMHALKI